MPCKGDGVVSAHGWILAGCVEHSTLEPCGVGCCVTVGDDFVDDVMLLRGLAMQAWETSCCLLLVDAKRLLLLSSFFFKFFLVFRVLLQR